MALEFRVVTTARAEEAKAKRDAPIMLLSLFVITTKKKYSFLLWLCCTIGFNP
jgi:hypothetical protein